MLREQSQFMLVIYFKLFLELGLICQTGIYHDSNMLFRSWGAWHILPTYEQLLTTTKFVSSKFVAGMKKNQTVEPLLSVIRCVNT
jgi:hypothetical protein